MRISSIGKVSKRPKEDERVLERTVVLMGSSGIDMPASRGSRGFELTHAIRASGVKDSRRISSSEARSG